MICFDLYLNGERLCRAGKEDISVLSSILSYVIPRGGGKPELELSVGGLSTLPDADVHSKWLHGHEIRVGDEVTIRIVEADTSDEPASQTVETADWKQEQERRYYERIKAQYEDPTESGS